MNINEKLVSDFMKLGNVERKIAVLALQVYLELREVKKYWNVECKYHNELKILYITAKKSKSECSSIFVPLPLNQDLSFKNMVDYFKLCENDVNIKGIFLVLVAGDSTCVYYQLSHGLHEPTDLVNKKQRDNKQEKLDADLRKHRKLIEHAALCCIPVTLTNKEDKN